MNEIEKPIDIATRETVAFLHAHVSPAAALLEIGCGAGHVARALLDAGYGVLALDADAAAVEQARALGVDARCAAWPDFRGGPFDAIAFTRSLHHIDSLDEAVRRARELLRPGGVLLVEDFAFAEIDDATIEWFADVVRSRIARELVQPVPGEMVTALMEAGADAKPAWHGQDDHDLHTWATMTEAITRHFQVRDSRAVPYLYRYLVRVLLETPSTAAFVGTVLAEEARLAERGEIKLIGRRVVGFIRRSC